VCSSERETTLDLNTRSPSLVVTFESRALSELSEMQYFATSMHMSERSQH
jgi:hypothetical protein